MIKPKAASSSKDQAPEPEFQAINGKRLLFCFDEPELTGEAGLLALAEFEKGLGLFDKLAGCLRDRRKGSLHGCRDLVAQRAMQIAAGDGDAAGCSRLRADPAIKLAVGSEADLASQPTMSRLENRARPRELLRMAYALGELFLDSFEGKAPEMIVIDMDPTAHLVYGQQQLSLFSSHVGDSCLMPFHVYDGVTGRLICAALRPGKVPTAREILALLKRIVGRIRSRFPDTRLMFRADSHHSKPAAMDWLAENEVDWAVGQQPNSALRSLVADRIDRASSDWKLREKSLENAYPIRRYASVEYKAASWKEPRRVVCRIEAGPLGTDVRYVSTSLREASARAIYEGVYCDRARAELMIKDHKLGLRSDRSPCRSACANQFRLTLHSAVYVLLHRFREKVLARTPLARACFQRIRLELLKLAARVETLKTRVKVHLPLSFRFKQVFVSLAGGEEERLA